MKVSLKDAATHIIKDRQSIELELEEKRKQLKALEMCKKHLNLNSLLVKRQLEIIIFLFVVTAAGVVPCGIPKMRPRTSSIVQFISYFWSFEISRNVLRNQKTLSV